MFLFDFIILGFYFLFKNIYYRNNEKYFGFGIEEYVVVLFVFFYVLFLLIGIDFFCYLVYDEWKFNSYLGFLIFLLVFICFFFVYLGKGWLKKILFGRYSVFLKVIYFMVSLVYIVILFWLFIWGIEFVFNFFKGW